MIDKSLREAETVPESGHNVFHFAGVRIEMD
jgi:hypothetical protein